MNTLLDLVAEAALSEAAVQEFLHRGGDIEATNPAGETALLVACRLRQLAAVRLLLKYGADVYALSEDDTSALSLSYCAVETLIPLMEHKLELDRQAQAEAEEGEFELVSCTPSDIARDIKELFAGASLDFNGLESLQVVGAAVDLGSKLEAAIIELGFEEAQQRLEYSYSYNWAYGESHLYLRWVQGDSSKVVLEVMENDVELSRDALKRLSELGIALGLGHLSLEATAKALLFLLSRMVQRKLVDYHEHRLYYYLNPDEYISPDRYLAANFAVTPLSELQF